MEEKKLSETEQTEQQKHRREWEEKRRENRRRRKRRVRLLRIAAVLACGLILILAALGIASALRGCGQSRRRGGVVPGEVPASETWHFSFPALDQQGEGSLTAAQFDQILGDLYQRGYVLVDIHQLAGENKRGELVQSSFPLEQGKIPMVLSQRGFTLEEGGDTLIRHLEDFIKEHPDFSLEGARGLLVLQGDFSGGLEEEECKKACKDLRKDGWSFASGGYGSVSYGSELSLVREDAEQWESQVESLAGETDVLLFPFQTDLGSWGSYGTENQKYTYLRELGFRYFCVEDDNPCFVQIGKDYVHQGIHEIDNYEQYLEEMQ